MFWQTRARTGHPVPIIKSEMEAPSLADGMGVTFANPVVNNWQVGIQIRAGSSTVRNMKVTIPVPVDWPEQSVELVDEVVPPEVRSAKPRSLNSGVQQMVIEIPRIRSKTAIEIKWTFQVRTAQINPPRNTAALEIPNKIPREAKEYIGVSPQITYRNSKLRKQVKEIVADHEQAWQQIEAIYDWVRDNIEYVDGDPDDTISVFRKRQGCAEDIVGLFVAMCRAQKVPARVVWVEGHQHAEFMLVDPNANPHWIPCQVAGLREFGSISEPRIVLQKGDNIKVPEKEHRQKYVAEFVTGSGKTKPKVQFIRKLLPADQK